MLYNPEHRGIEYDLLPWCRKNKVTVMAYSPIGQGGKLLDSAALRGIARKHGVSPAQVAIALVSAAAGAGDSQGRLDRAREENAAAEALDLDAQDLAEIDRSFQPQTEAASRHAVKLTRTPFDDRIVEFGDAPL